MESGTDRPVPDSISGTETSIEEYEQLLDDLYNLAREYAELEAEDSDGESADRARYDEIRAEMNRLRTATAELHRTFDESDFEDLFEVIDE